METFDCNSDDGSCHASDDNDGDNVDEDGDYDVAHLHASLDDVERSVAEHGSGTRHDSKSARDELGDGRTGVGVSPVQLLQRLYNKEPGTTLTSLL